jgi:hypothetical protein
VRLAIINAIHNGAPGTLSLEILTIAKDWAIPPWIITNEQPTEAVRQKWLALGYLYNQQLAKAMQPAETFEDGI